MSKEKKTEILHTRIAPTLKADLERVSEEKGMPVSKVVDYFLTKGVRNHDFSNRKEN